MSTGPWINHRYCPHCGVEVGPVYFRDFHLVAARLCESCGYYGGGWLDVRVRWLSEAVWYKPWTWLRGEWEVHEEDEWAYVRAYELARGLAGQEGQ